MRILLDGEQLLRVQATGGPLVVEPTAPGVEFSPLHMLAASLATCTVSVLAGWALQAGLELEGLEIGVAWEYVEAPYRVGRFDLSIRWPGLPADRHAAALRVAEHCTVEQTLKTPPDIELRLAA